VRLLLVGEQMQMELGLRDIDLRGCDGDCRIRRFQILRFVMRALAG
jgi:hypothetical protein